METFRNGVTDAEPHVCNPKKDFLHYLIINNKTPIKTLQLGVVSQIYLFIYLFWWVKLFKSKKIFKKICKPRAMLNINLS